MKKNIFFKVLAIILVIAVIGIIINYKISAKKQNDSEVSLGNLDINSEIVQSLYSKILKCNKTAIDYEGSFYKNEKTTTDTLSNFEKSIAIVQNLTDKETTAFKDLEKDIQKELIKRVEKHYERDFDISEGNEYIRNLKIYSEKDLQEKTLEIFGNNIEIEFENLDSGFDSYWEYINGSYYSFSGYGGGGYGPPNDAYGKIQYAIEDKEYIYIFDKFIYLRDFPSDSIYSNAYKTSIESPENDLGTVSEHMKYDTYEDYQNSLKNVIDILNDKLYIYKHTFKKGENGDYYWVSTEVDSNQKETDNVKSNVNLGNIDINSELVQNLYSKILKSNDIAYNFEGSFYKEEKTTLSNLTNKEILIATIQSLPDKEFTSFKDIDKSISEKLGYYPNKSDESQYVHLNTLKIYSEKEIIEHAKNIFGKDVNIEITSLNGCAHAYDFFDKKLYSYDYEGGGFGDLNSGYGEIQYAIEDNEFIYIFDKFIYKDEYNENYYKSSNTDIPLEVGNKNIASLEDYLMYNINDLYLYKHTFKKAENGDYYWVSTEKYIEN